MYTNQITELFELENLLSLPDLNYDEYMCFRCNYSLINDALCFPFFHPNERMSLPYPDVYPHDFPF
jgi:hypothetical protein